MLDRSVRRSFGFSSQFGSRGILSFSQTINFIVKQQNGNIHIPADSMNKMVTPDSQCITITGDLQYIQFPVGILRSGSNSGSTSMNCMEPIGIHIIRETGRTSDTGNHSPGFFGIAQFSHRFLHGINNTVITATRTPSDFLVAFKIFRSIFRSFQFLIFDF